MIVTSCKESVTTKRNYQDLMHMIEWATTNGKAVRHRSVRQETTMLKTGTLLLNMYKTSDYPKDEVSFSPDTVEEQPATSASTVTFYIIRGHCRWSE